MTTGHAYKSALVIKKREVAATHTAPQHTFQQTYGTRRCHPHVYHSGSQPTPQTTQSALRLVCSRSTRSARTTRSTSGRRCVCTIDSYTATKTLYSYPNLSLTLTSRSVLKHKTVSESSLPRIHSLTLGVLLHAPPQLPYIPPE